jgi:hypothetical protein
LHRRGNKTVLIALGAIALLIIALFSLLGWIGGGAPFQAAALDPSSCGASKWITGVNESGSGTLTPVCSYLPPIGPYDYLVNTTTISGTKYYYGYSNQGILKYGGPSNIGGISGTNASSVLNTMTSDLAGVCGSIFFYQNLAITNTILVYPCETLEGPSGSGDFAVYAGTAQLSSSSSMTGPAVEAEVNNAFPTHNVFPVFRDFTITGSSSDSSTSNDGILISSVNGNILDVNIFDVRVFAMGGNCFNLASPLGKYFMLQAYAENCRQDGIKEKAGLLMISQSYIFGNSLAGIATSSSGGFVGSELNFRNNVQQGLILGPLGGPGIITNSYFANNGGSAYPDITLNPSTGVTANTISGNSILESRTGASRANFAINIPSAATTSAMITANGISGTYQMGVIGITGTPATPATLLIGSNVGYNPVASSAVTAGASVWTYINTDGYDEQMILTTVGGITAETCNGIVGFPVALDSSCILPPGNSLVVTWAASAPVYTKVPLVA